METSEEVFRGSGNVFADLGLPDAEEHFLKAEIVVEIKAILGRWGYSETEASERMKISIENLRGMLRGHFRQYSTDRLLRMVNALGSDVRIVISTSETPDDNATLSVVAA